MSLLHRPVRCKVKADGFTLIEVMIVCAIIAVLSAIAIPFYGDYVTRGKIPEATAALAAKKIAIDAWYSDKFAYTGATACATDNTTSNNFTFTCVIAANGAGYTLTATGKNSMPNSFVYTIDAAGNKTSKGPTGWGTSSNCWITKKGGTC